jgi:hypothetical protein
MCFTIGNKEIGICPCIGSMQVIEKENDNDKNVWECCLCGWYIAKGTDVIFRHFVWDGEHGGYYQRFFNHEKEFWCFGVCGQDLHGTVEYLDHYPNVRYLKVGQELCFGFECNSFSIKWPWNGEYDAAKVAKLEKASPPPENWGPSNQEMN